MTAWLPTAREPQQRSRPNAISARVIDFHTLPPMVAHEIRYVVGTKVVRGDWTPNGALLDYLTHLTVCVRTAGAQSLLDRRPEDWSLLVQQQGSPTSAAAAKSYSRTFFATLHRALVSDPWAHDRWLYKDSMDGLIHRKSAVSNGTNLHWDRITQDWLREPLKAYAKVNLVTGKRAWATVLTWAQAMAPLSRYLTDEGIDAPEDLDRWVFLDYLEGLNDAGASKHALSNANVAANLLKVLNDEHLRQQRGKARDRVPLFGSDAFLHYGENSVPKTREPKPYPADVIARIDADVLTDDALDPSAREMLQLTRWGGLRISELVTLDIDCLRDNTKGGYWVRYWMSKTQDWRRFPVPADVAQRLLDQQAHVRATYGPDAKYMFPSPSRSNPSAQRDQPWSANGFRKTVRESFERNGITHSTITGEPISGGAIHRFRHTIGTRLLNSGWTQREVQDFLGHASPTMTQAYAEITDDTLIKKFRRFREEQAEAEAAGRPLDNDPIVESLRSKFVYELPDGGCTLPITMKCDARDNPCVGCDFFTATEDTRQVNVDRRLRLKLHVESATDPRERAVNQNALDAVERVLADDETSA